MKQNCNVKSTFSPIALFVYKRINHTIKTIEALQNNEYADKTDLFIFSDGYKGKEDYRQVAEVRSYIKKIDGFKSVNVIERDKNFGLSKSIISGVTHIVQNYGRIIVVEDDIVTSKYFLKYMNDYLTLYEKDENVISISGYFYPIKLSTDYNIEIFFLKGAECWGWATWKREWKLFEPDGKKLLLEIKKQKCKRELNLNNTFNFFKMLKEQIAGKNDSWAIRWHVSAFLNNKYTLYPLKSLVYNSGLDGSGSHCIKTNCYDIQLNNEPIICKKIEIKENNVIIKSLEKYFQSLKIPFHLRIINYILKKIKKIFNIIINNDEVSKIKV